MLHILPRILSLCHYKQRIIPSRTVQTNVNIAAKRTPGVMLNTNVKLSAMLHRLVHGALFSSSVIIARRAEELPRHYLNVFPRDAGISGIYSNVLWCYLCWVNRPTRQRKKSPLHTTRSVAGWRVSKSSSSCIKIPCASVLLILAGLVVSLSSGKPVLKESPWGPLCVYVMLRRFLSHERLIGSTASCVLYGQIIPPTQFANIFINGLLVYY